MNDFSILFTFVTAGMLLFFPRGQALVPLLLGAAYVPITQSVEIGPLHFPVIRLLICTGFLRVLIRKERPFGGVCILDRVMVLWAFWAVTSAAFHKSGVFVYRLGVVYDSLGSYLLFRVFIQGLEDLPNVVKAVCVVLSPLALTMAVERTTGKNPLALVGFAMDAVEFRGGHYRAHGPFAHPILSGSVGAVCLPLALSLWRSNRRLACLGVAASGTILFSSGSSGPLMAAASVLAALATWRIRQHLRTIRWAAVLLVLALNAVMNAPVYYLMQRIDLVGGSTGWYRARLIESSIEHLDEWWLAGTDYTRHWMPTGITANSDHVDMVNYYLQMGVWGGLLLTALFVGALVVAFSRVGQALRLNENGPTEEQFLIWTLGCVLLGHAVTFFSISYFDQTFIFLQLALASIGSLQISAQAPSPLRTEVASWPTPEQEPAHAQIS
jgi:hypothetical protein